MQVVSEPNTISIVHQFGFHTVVAAITAAGGIYSPDLPKRSG
jgi:hypothetical protein